MTVITTSTLLTGRLTKMAHAMLVCVSLLKLLWLLALVVGVVLIVRDGVLQRGTFPLLNQFMIDGMPLGNLSSGLVYALFVMLPLHSVFGCLGLLGVIYHKQLLIIIYTCFLLFGIVMDMVFIVLFSLILEGINTWVKYRFIDYYNDYSASRLNTEVQQAFSELFDAMNCKSAELSDSGAGCWDKYYPVMNGTITVFIMLLSVSIVMEIITIILMELIYRRLGRENHQQPLPGMLKQLCSFVCRTNEKNCLFAAIDFLDVICSGMFVFGGVIISQSRLITDSRLRPIFENMRFNKYYLPGIVLGLAITMILIGCLNAVSSVLGCVMLCFKSNTKSKVSLTWQVFTIILLIAGACFWIPHLLVVYRDMFDQLHREFLVYGGNTHIQLYYTRAWNALFVTEQTPIYCRSGAAISNSDLQTLASPTMIYNQDYYTTMCETPLKEEIKQYAIVFGVFCGIVLITKIFNIIYFYKFGFENDSEQETETSSWQIFMNYLKENKCRSVGFMVFTLLGLLFSLGLLITGVYLGVDDILGHKDIKVLFEYIYIAGRDVTSWVRIMSIILVSIGCVSFVIYCVGIVTIYLGMGPMYYMAVIAVVTSLVFKLIAILAWIPLRVAFDRDLRGEMYRALQDYYVTDNPASGIALYIEDKNLGFNTLFHQGKCCLRQSSVFSNLQLNGRLTGSWPWTCNHCDNDYGIRWPYLNSYVRNLCPINSAYSEDCTTTILDSTLHHYDTTAVVFAALMILLDILLLVILDRAYKGRVARGDRGIFSNIFLNNRCINDKKMPTFKHLALGLCFVQAASMVLDVAALIMISVHFDDRQLDQMYVGTLYLSEMIQGANITLLVVIPISIIFGVFNVVSSLCKWNTGLLLSTLPLTLHLIVDIVLIGMYSQLLESIRLSDRSIYRDVYVLTLAYLCINISAQIILFALKDRLYKRIESSFSVRDPQGLLSWFWGRVRRLFRIYSGKTTSAAMRFCFLSCLLMIWDIAMWIAVFLQLISPGYLQGTFRKELGQEYDDDYFIGVLITLLVLELVYVILHILSVIVVILNKNKSFSKYVVWLLLAFILISDIVMTGLASDWLNKAYTCTSSSTFCSTHVSRLYDLSGVYVGLNVAHIYFMGVLLVLFYCIYTSSASTAVSPNEQPAQNGEIRMDEKAVIISPSRPLTSNSEAASILTIS